MKINGKEIADRIFENLKKKAKKLKEKNLIPRLSIILIDKDPASVVYVNQKEIKGKKIGAKIKVKNLPTNTTQSKLLSTIEQFNNDNNIHGIIVQRPLPKNINGNAASLAIDPEKDVDGFHPNSKFQPPIALAVLRILKEIYWKKSEIRNPKSEMVRQAHHPEQSRRTNSQAKPDQNTSDKNVSNLVHSNFDIVSSFDIRISNFITWLKSQKIVVIGKGETGGKPIIEMLKKMNIEPSIIDSKTENKELIAKKADIIISAVGKPDIIKPEMIKKDSILISIGLSKGKDGKLHGDYDEEKIKNIASFYTPTPGGVGPVNVAMLLKNLTTATENLSQDNLP